MQPLVSQPGVLVQIHTDGAMKRSTLKSSAAYAISVVSNFEGKVSRQIVHVSACLIKSSSAFRAEAIALANAFRFVNTVMRKPVFPLFP